jgi:lysophospholipid acyltransferase
MLVTYEQCMGAWRSVYFLPHLAVVAMCIFGEVFGGKKKKAKAAGKGEQAGMEPGSRNGPAVGTRPAEEEAKKTE